MALAKVSSSRVVLHITPSQVRQSTVELLPPPAAGGDVTFPPCPPDAPYIHHLFTTSAAVVGLVSRPTAAPTDGGIVECLRIAKDRSIRAAAAATCCAERTLIAIAVKWNATLPGSEHFRSMWLLPPYHFFLFNCACTLVGSFSYVFLLFGVAASTVWLYTRTIRRPSLCRRTPSSFSILWGTYIDPPYIVLVRKTSLAALATPLRVGEIK